MTDCADSIMINSMIASGRNDTNEISSIPDPHCSADMLRAVRGEPCGNIPWAPRMDLWYIALRERGELPEGLENADIVDIAEHFGFDCHAVRADYTRKRLPEERMFRSLGFENHPDFPFRLELEGLPCDFTVDGEETILRVETSAGVITDRVRYSYDMRKRGISQPFKLEYPVEELEDLDRVAELFEHLRIVPDPLGYRAFHDRVGETGLAVAQGCNVASPIHLLLHDLMPMDRFFFWYYDHYDTLKRFEERLTPFFDNLLEVVSGCSAETVYWGANYDRDLTWPLFFERDIAPWLNKARERLHRSGKKLVCHPDGESSGLFDSYRLGRFDVAESVCAAPMTELDLLSQRRGFGDEVTIWGGIPSVLLLPDSTGIGAFEAHLSKLESEMDGLAPGRSRLILGVSDNVPPDCDLGRLEAVGAWAAGL